MKKLLNLYFNLNGSLNRRTYFFAYMGVVIVYLISWVMPAVITCHEPDCIQATTMGFTKQRLATEILLCYPYLVLLVKRFRDIGFNIKGAVIWVAITYPIYWYIEYIYLPKNPESLIWFYYIFTFTGEIVFMLMPGKSVRALYAQKVKGQV